MLSLGFDPLSSIVAAVDEGDLLPLALTCTTLRYVCNLRSDETRDPNGPRWYTHGTSRLTWAVDVMGATPNEKWCSYAAKHGHLDFLKCLRENHCPWNKMTCIAAAENNHLDILQWARQNGCPWDKWVCVCTAMKGHVEVLQWLRQNGCPSCDEMICSEAAKCGHLNVLQWARNNDYSWGNTCQTAAISGHLDILQWARQNGCPWNKKNCIYYASLAQDDETRHWIQAQP